MLTGIIRLYIIKALMRIKGYFEMKAIAVIILLIFGVSVLFPAMLVYAGEDSSGTSIRGLDVCHSKIAADAPELPYISACPCRLYPPVCTESAEPAQIDTRHFIMAFQEEHPPKICS